MSEMTYFAPGLMALCIFSLFGLVFFLRKEAPEVGNESWRDRPPLLFRLERPLVNLFVDQVERSMRPYQRELIQDRLNRAGMGYALRPEEFVVSRRIGLGVGLLLFAYVYFNLNIQNTWVLIALTAVLPIGYFYPDIWLRDAFKRRESLTAKQFPFFLDLLVLSMRAGLNFSSAIAHGVEKIPDGPVRTEFGRLLRETRTGVSRREALVHLAKRMDIASITNFVAVINQAEETGGELGDVLITQAAQRRSERFLRAEKLANQAPVKMLFPLVVLLFPITFVIVFFPLYIKARDTGALDFLFQ